MFLNTSAAASSNVFPNRDAVKREVRKPRRLLQTYNVPSRSVTLMRDHETGWRKPMKVCMYDGPR